MKIESIDFFYLSMSISYRFVLLPETIGSIAYINKNLKGEKIELSAQKYLDKFYKDLGFYKTGEDYLEDGIPHQRMIKEID